MYKSIIRPLLFLFSPENAHKATFQALKFLHTLPGVGAIMRAKYGFKHPRLKREVFGLHFDNPVGLAAGFDKDGVLIDEFSNLGFGFIEIGTTTPLAQAGNEKPRLFRLTADNAIINRMGFNNKGLDFAIQRLKSRKSHTIVGGNIGKNKITPNDDAAADYLKCFEGLYPFVDYFVVNVSSPNTPNLRELQEKEPLKKLLSTLQDANRQKPKSKPILLKIAPDLSNEQLDDVVEIVQETGISGIIATNTTISRDKLSTSKATLEAIGNGGLSGKPIKSRATEVVRYISEKSGKKIPIIAVGGIFTPEDAEEKLRAGASLVQVYTGLIYEGPSLVKRINKHLAALGQF